LVLNILCVISFVIIVRHPRRCFMGRSIPFLHQFALAISYEIHSVRHPLDGNPSKGWRME